MNPFLPVLRTAAAFAVCAVTVSIHAAAPDDVLVRTPEVVITRADWDAELMRIPVDQRTAFAASTMRVQSALNNLLVNRTLAERARAKGVDKDPVAARRFAVESERILAGLMIEQIETEAGAEFDRMNERNVARARELYLINEPRYTIPEQIDVTHILFDTTKKGKEAALAAATEARTKVLAGADFGALALAMSDDPSAAQNKGRLNGIGRSKTDPAFEKAAFALANPGDVSEPVLSRFGYHVIRLEERKPARLRAFAEVQNQILSDMRQKYVAEAKDSTIAGIRGDTRAQVNQEAVDALVVKVDVPPLPLAPPSATPGSRRNKM